LFFQLLLFLDVVNIGDNKLKAVDARKNCCDTEQVYFAEILCNGNLEAFDATDDWIFI
jgi:hypothetical protein